MIDQGNPCPEHSAQRYEDARDAPVDVGHAEEIAMLERSLIANDGQPHAALSAQGIATTRDRIAWLRSVATQPDLTGTYYDPARRRDRPSSACK